MTYEEKENESGVFYIVYKTNDREFWIPKDESNADYQRYLRWLEDPTAEEGGTLS